MPLTFSLGHSIYELGPQQMPLSKSTAWGKAKQLSAQAAEMPGQPARGGPRAGGHNEARVVNEWQSTRAGHHGSEREGGECM